MAECIGYLGEARILSSLQANSRYWQIKIDKLDRSQPAFMSHHVLFQFARMPFALNIVPATFQLAMYVILLSVNWKSVLVYHENIVIFSQNVTDHMAQLRQVLNVLCELETTLKFKMCSLLRKSLPTSVTLHDKDVWKYTRKLPQPFVNSKTSQLRPS